MIFVRILAILARWQWGKLGWLGWMPSNGPAGVGQIRQERNAYYDILEATQNVGLEITPWLELDG
jgi:hypothetical protein